MMNIQRQLEEMINIQEYLLDFIENESDNDESFMILNNFFDELKICDDQHKLMSLLHLLTKISNNHHHTTNFYDKIDRILKKFLKSIKKFYLNSEIFDIFKSNKRLLLFLIEQKVINVDEYFVKNIITAKYIEAQYHRYFSPEIKPFLDEEWFPKYDPKNYKLCNNVWVDEIKKELPDNFYENRKIGENENYICKLMRNDSVEEFIIYVNKNNLSLKTKIIPSIYETNKYLIKNQKSKKNYLLKTIKNDNVLTMMDYSVFFGSIQIIKYLVMNNVELTKPLLFYTIHSQNPELIHYLEENDIEPEKKSYKECFKESIKCHHNDIANYFKDNFLQKEEENLNEYFVHILKNYNFQFIQNDMINEESFYNICYYGYYLFADNLLKNNNIDVNKVII